MNTTLSNLLPHQQEEVEKLTDLLGSVTDRKPKVIFFGNPDAGYGKTRYIMEMLRERGVEVVHMQPGEVKMLGSDWTLLAEDEFDTIVVDSMNEFVPQQFALPKPERHGPRAVTTGKGRSRFDRQNRWR